MSYSGCLKNEWRRGWDALKLYENVVIFSFKFVPDKIMTRQSTSFEVISFVEVLESIIPNTPKIEVKMK